MSSRDRLKTVPDRFEIVEEHAILNNAVRLDAFVIGCPEIGEGWSGIDSAVDSEQS